MMRRHLIADRRDVDRPVGVDPYHRPDAERRAVHVGPQLSVGALLLEVAGPTCWHPLTVAPLRNRHRDAAPDLDDGRRQGAK